MSDDDEEVLEGIDIQANLTCPAAVKIAASFDPEVWKVWTASWLDEDGRPWHRVVLQLEGAVWFMLTWRLGRKAVYRWTLPAKPDAKKLTRLGLAGATQGQMEGPIGPFEHWAPAWGSQGTWRATIGADPEVVAQKEVKAAMAW